MKEESQLAAMRAALRCDRERAEHARQRSSENVLALLDAPSPEPPEQERPPSQRRSLLGRLLGR